MMGELPQAIPQERDEIAPGTLRLVVELPPDLFRKLELEAEEREITIQKLLIDLATGWFRAHHPR